MEALKKHKLHYKKLNVTLLLLCVMLLLLSALEKIKIDKKTTNEFRYQQEIANLQNRLNKQSTASRSTVTPPPTFSQTFKSLADPYNPCTIEECLFQYHPDSVGTTTIEGYFTKYDTTGYEGEKVTCDRFTVTKAPKPFIEEILQLIAQNNGLYDKNDLNQPIIGISDELLTQSEKNTILESNENKKIKLLILAKSLPEGGTYTCHEGKIALRIL